MCVSVCECVYVFKGGCHHVLLDEINISVWCNGEVNVMCFT